MRRSLVPLLLFLALGPVIARAEPDPAEPARPLTAMAGGPLGRAALVVLAEIEDVRQIRGMVMARLRPERVLKGESGGASTLTVVARGPKAKVDPDTPALVRGKKAVLDPRAPTIPYLLEGTTGRAVFFLRRRPGGVSYLLDAMFEVKDALGREKLEILEKHVELGRIPEPDRRARQTLAFLVEASGKGGTWTRVHAARELNHLAGVRPDVFDSGTLTELGRQVRRAAVPLQRSWLCRLLRTLEGRSVPPGAEAADTEPDVGGDDAEPDRAPPGPPDPAARIATLERFLHAGGRRAASTLLERIAAEDPEVRAWVVTTLAEGGYRALLPRIRRLYAGESSPEVLRAVVRATGLLGGEGGDVAWLRQRLANGRVFREVLFALARIGTPHARRILAEVRHRAAESAPPRDDIVALVDYLSGAAFAEVEAAAGRFAPAPR